MESTIVAPATPTLRESVAQLIALVTAGQIMPALRRFYSENVVMRDNNGAPTGGLAANLVREEGFVAYIESVQENRAESVTVDEENNTAAIHWNFAFTGTDGKRLRFNQIALQEWNNGKIVRETFFYDSASIAN